MQLQPNGNAIVRRRRVNVGRKADVRIPCMRPRVLKGLRELNNTALWASADLRAYRKERNTFYLLKFWRAFPPEDPTATPHLRPSGRGQSVLWRGLRPELVRSNPVPLSPDANMLVTHNAPDWREQRDGVLEATRRLVHQVRSARAEARVVGMSCLFYYRECVTFAMLERNLAHIGLTPEGGRCFPIIARSVSPFEGSYAHITANSRAKWAVIR